MGSSSSKAVEDINASDIAAFVGELGNSFKQYEEGIRRSGISGSELAYLKGESLLIQLETAGVSNRLHRRKLACVCRKYFSNINTGAMSDKSYNSDNGDTCSITTADSGEYNNRRSSSTPPPLGGLRPNISFGDRSFASTYSDDDSVLTPPKANANFQLENMGVAQSAEALTLLIRMENQKRLLRQSDQPSGPPTGKAAIVLTDVQGSTALWEADPKAMREALSLHDEIMRQHRAEHGGYEVDTEGDAFTMAFHTAQDALSFALALQAALRDAPWGDDILELDDAAEDPLTEDRGLRVRVAVHMGPVTTRTNAVTGRLEYEGYTMERAREVEAMAEGGQILATRATWEAAKMAAQTTDRGNDVVQVLCSQRSTRRATLSTTSVQNLMMNDSIRDLTSMGRRACADNCDEQRHTSISANKQRRRISDDQPRSRRRRSRRSISMNLQQSQELSTLSAC